MQIQRIQSLYLFIAAILTCVIGLMTYSNLAPGHEPYSDGFFFNNIGLLILNAISTILLIVSIFMFKKLKRQILTTKINFILVLLSILLSVTLLYNVNIKPTLTVVCEIAMLVVADIFIVLALRAIDKDRKRLAAADRIR